MWAWKRAELDEVCHGLVANLANSYVPDGELEYGKQISRIIDYVFAYFWHLNWPEVQQPICDCSFAPGKKVEPSANG